MKTLVKLISLLIGVVLLTGTIYAHHQYITKKPGSEIAKNMQIKSENPTELLASMDNAEIKEEKKALEEWMFKKDFKTIWVESRKNIESWMNDPEFWKIEVINDDEEIEEEAIQVEEWMIHFEKNLSCVGCNELIEKDWMSSQQFFIL